MRPPCLAILAAAVCVAGACTEPKRGGPFSLASDTVAVFAPGEATVVLTIDDTAGNPAVSVTGAFTASIEDDPGEAAGRLLRIVATTADTGVVRLMSVGNADSVVVVASPRGGAISIAAEEVSIAAPSQWRFAFAMDDTTTAPTVHTTGGLVATRLPGKAFLVKAGLPGIGYVILRNPGNADSLKITATAQVFKNITVEQTHACAVGADDRAWCWGKNALRQVTDYLGAVEVIFPRGRMDDLYSWATLPVQAGGERTFSTLDVGGEDGPSGAYFGGGSTCGVTPLGEVWCWGHATTGLAPVRLGPDRLYSSVSTWFVRSRATDTCALTATGEAYCLTTTSSTRVGGTLTFTSLSIASTHSCGVSGGDVYCWGNNTSGQLGIGSADANTHPEPEKATGGIAYTSVKTGTGYTCALSTAKQVYCWGAGVAGSTNAVSPQLMTSDEFDSFDIAESGTALCALTAAGVAQCWSAFTASPTTVTAPVAFKQISVGGLGDPTNSYEQNSISCGLSHAGAVYCWNKAHVAKKLGAP